MNILLRKFYMCRSLSKVHQLDNTRFTDSLSSPKLRLASTADYLAHSNALLVHAMKPYMTILICGNPQFIQTAIRTLLHNTMEVKTVLNLEADARDLCQDTITNTQ